VIKRHKVVLLFEAHLLTAIKKDSHPLNVVPSGLKMLTKAVYIFAKDPTPGVDEGINVIGTAKFNYHKKPESRRYAFDVTDVKVIRFESRGHVAIEVGKWIDRGETPVSVKMLVASLTPETTERKNDRLSAELTEFLLKGKDGRMQPVRACQEMVESLDPPVNWRTAQRVAKKMGMESVDDPKNARKKWWRLPDEWYDVYAEVTEEDDEVEITEIDAPDDTFPADWTGEDA
jgi:hypothetical protein